MYICQKITHQKKIETGLIDAGIEGATVVSTREAFSRGQKER
jgi:hypothetical protein